MNQTNALFGGAHGLRPFDVAAGGPVSMGGPGQGKLWAFEVP